jgi:hypothetical protein
VNRNFRGRLQQVQPCCANDVSDHARRNALHIRAIGEEVNNDIIAYEKYWHLATIFSNDKYQSTIYSFNFDPWVAQFEHERYESSRLHIKAHSNLTGCEEMNFQVTPFFIGAILNILSVLRVAMQGNLHNCKPSFRTPIDLDLLGYISLFYLIQNTKSFGLRYPVRALLYDFVSPMIPIKSIFKQ